MLGGRAVDSAVLRHVVAAVLFSTVRTNLDFWFGVCELEGASFIAMSFCCIRSGSDCDARIIRRIVFGAVFFSY